MDYPVASLAIVVSADLVPSP